MATAIRNHLRDFLAILGLLVVGLVATYIIVQNERLRIPLLEEKPFQLKAEMRPRRRSPGTGADGPGRRRPDRRHLQGRVRGRHAVVTMDIDRKFLPVYRDATVLLRPKTGLKDMFLELDPGTDSDPSSEDEYEEGDTIPVANTAPT